MPGPLIDLRCKNGCPGMFCRARLNHPDDRIEAKCDRCGEVTVFTAEQKPVKVIRDSVGGWLTVPVDGL